MTRIPRLHDSKGNRFLTNPHIRASYDFLASIFPVHLRAKSFCRQSGVRQNEYQIALCIRINIFNRKKERDHKQERRVPRDFHKLFRGCNKLDASLADGNMEAVTCQLQYMRLNNL